jgi:hypothetical protein
VIDWKSCPLEDAVLDEILEAQDDTRVVLWGAPRETEAAFLWCAKRGTWLGCAPSASTPHVASLVLELLAG